MSPAPRLLASTVLLGAALLGCAGERRGAGGGDGESGGPCAVNTAFQRFTDIPAAVAPPFDPAKEIHVRTPAEEDAARRILVDAGWGGALPRDVPFHVSPRAVDLTGLPVKAAPEAWLSTYGVTTYVLRPAGYNGRAVIVHQGHASYEARWKGGVDLLIGHLLRRGFAVAVMQMPLNGWNPKVWPSHAAMIAAMGDRALAWFVGPVIEVVNELYERHSDVSMVGFSGGGWTTVLAAALDERISRSAAVAGSLPTAYRNAYKREVCSYRANDEQSDFAFYRRVTYEDLYLLGVSRGRWQVQINNQFDSCCFYGVSAQLYAPHVIAAATGTWSAVLDTTHEAHRVSPEALRAIDDLLGP